MSFRYLLRVRYAECDAQGVVFNSRYADYVDVAATEYYRLLFGGYDKLLAQGLDTQVVNYQINWSAPARFDQIVAIDVSTSRIGNSAFTLTHRFSDAQSGAAIATAEITYVMVDATAFTKTDIPDEIRNKLSTPTIPATVDHASGCP